MSEDVPGFDELNFSREAQRVRKDVFTWTSQLKERLKDPDHIFWLGMTR